MIEDKNIHVGIIGGLGKMGRWFHRFFAELGYQVVLASDAHSTYSKGPEKVIKRWHGELSETGVTLSAAKEISF